MKNKTFKQTKINISLTFCILLCSVLLNYNCEEFLEADSPPNQISNADVFNDENTATAAVTTLYGKLRDQSLLTGAFGMSFSLALYSDELDYYGTPGFSPDFFYQHQILPSNNMVGGIWDDSYKLIYLSNEILEGLNSSNSLDEGVKNQLIGEATFVRAFVHFYLVNLFGDVPYITITDYQVNSEVRREPENIVYEKIINDLLYAKTLLGDDFLTDERVRPNKSVVSAFLARVYLYLEQWENAEAESSLLINNNALFMLESDLNNEFLKESKSTIWQLKPKFEGDNTESASVFIFNSGPPPSSALNPLLVEAMEEGDLRKINWIGQVTDGTNSWFFPFKYKQNNNTGVSMEYPIVLRLAEQYLIRAESRVMLGDLSGAQEDLNKIRNRAGLSNTGAQSIEDMLDAVLKERRFELFTEFGHRWFDLKRTGRAESILSPIKPGWRSTDILLPIPEIELSTNPNLNPQNPGY